MSNLLEFPSKTFSQWGAIVQEIVPYLARRGASKEEIRAVVDRVRLRWEQLERVAPCHGAGIADEHEAAPASRAEEEHALYISRHWRSEPARTLIESAGADYQRHFGG